MLNREKAFKILDIVKEETGYSDNLEVDFDIMNKFQFKYKGTWSCRFISPNSFLVIVSETYYDRDDLAPFLYKYLAKTFGFDTTWGEVYYKETLDLFAILHEISHSITIHEKYKNKTIDDFAEDVQRLYDYSNNKKKSYEARRLAYRKVEFEVLADTLAMKIFKNRVYDLLSIITDEDKEEIKKNKLMYNMHKIKREKLNIVKIN